MGPSFVRVHPKNMPRDETSPARFFGLHSTENLKGFLPQRLLQTLVEKKILQPSNLAAIIS